MCDQTEVAYLPNDIVWVKLSNVWWPGEVQDEQTLEEDITSGLKKKPLAVVKFFDEDSYEFPKNLNQIYHYNCLRKDEFIKKGLDMCRAETNSNRDLPYAMKKFPRDVEIAEVKTGGNPKYIYDPKFEPEEKFDYREHFGMKPLKKVKSERDSSSPLPQTYKVKPQTPKVTFFDLSNRSLSSSTSRIRTPTEKVLSNSARKHHNGTPPSILKTSSKYMRNKMPALTSFPCKFCDFSSKSVNGVIMHYRTHYRGEALPLPPCVPSQYLTHFQKNQQKLNGNESNRLLVSLSDKPPIKRKRFVEETETPKKAKNDTPKIIKRRTVASSNVSVSKTTNVEETAKPVTQKKRIKRARNEVESEALEILKDWDDFSEEESDMSLPPKKEKKDDLSINSLLTEENESTPKHETDTSPTQVSSLPLSSTAITASPTKTPEKSCFDFEDNDDAINLDLPLKFGQKLPRVINEKQSSSRISRQVRMEDDLKNDVDNFLETAQIPSLPQVPEMLTESGVKKVSDLVETSEDNNVVYRNVNKGEDKKELPLAVESASVNLKSPEQLEKRNNKRKIHSTDPEVASFTSEDLVVSSPTSEKDIEKKKFKIDENLDSHSNDTSSVITSGIRQQLPKNQITDVKFDTFDTCSATGDTLKQQKAFKEEQNTSDESIVESSDQQVDEQVTKINILELSEGDKLDKTKIEVIEEGGDQSTDNYADSLIIDETESPDNKLHYNTDLIVTDSIDSIVADSINNAVEPKKEHEQAHTVTQTQQTEANKHSELSSCKDAIQNKDIHATKAEENNESDCANDAVVSHDKIVEHEKKKKIDKLVALDTNDKEKYNETIELKAESSLSEIVEESATSNDLSSSREDVIIEEEEVSSKIESEMEKAGLEKIIVESNLVKEEVASNIENEMEKAVSEKIKVDNHIVKEEDASNVENEIEKDGHEKIKVETNLVKEEVSSNLENKMEMADCEKIKGKNNIIKEEVASNIENEIEKADHDKIKVENNLVKEEVAFNVEKEIEKVSREKMKAQSNSIKEEVTSDVAGNSSRDCTKKKDKIIKKEKTIKKEVTADTGNSSSTPSPMQDISLFDINSMPIIIQSENENLSEMEICCGPGPFVPDPDADVITVYLRKKGEELPEDFEPGKELITVKPPPPDFVPCHNMKRIPFPEGKPISSNAAQPSPGPSTSTSDKENRPSPSSSTSPNKENAAGSSNEVIVKPSTSSSSNSGKVTGTRKSNLITNTVGQQKQILVLPPSTSGKFIITSPQGSIVTGASSNAVSGTRPLKAQLTGKVQKKTVPKQIVVSKGNLPSTSKITLSQQLINQIKSTSSGQSIVQVKTQQGKIPVLSGPKQTTTSIKTQSRSVVQTEMKPPSSVPRGPTRATATSKSVRQVSGQQLPTSSSVVTSSQPERKHILKMKQSSPNILQKSPKKPLRQVRPQIVTVPKPPQSSDIVSSIQTGVVQGESTSTDSVLYLAVEEGSSVIPIASCDQENSGLLDTTLVNINSPSTSQGLDNIFLSIDGSNNFVKISNQTSSSASSSQKSGAQDILAEALANTQVLQTESGELCELDGTSIVTQEFPAPSLTNNVLETSLTYNTTPIMSTVEVPSSVAAGSQPSMPLLTDEIELKPQTVYINNSPATYQYIDVSGANLSTASDQQIVFTTSLLSSGDSKITSTENLLQTVVKDENVLPEFLKCDFSKRPEKSKKGSAQEGDT